MDFKDIKKDIETYTIEDEFNLKNATKDGYIFWGWLSGKEHICKIKKGTTGDLSLTAEWEIITYKIEYILDGGTNDSFPGGS